MNENNGNNSMNKNISGNQMYNTNNNPIYNQDFNNSNVQGYNQNINLNSNLDVKYNNNQNQVINSPKPKVKNKGLMITITIIVLILTIVGKFFSMGLLTIILTVTFILPLSFILFTSAGVCLANIRNKDKKDYIYFAVLCISILLWMISFIDCDDRVEWYGPMYSMNETLRSIIYYSSLITYIIFLILSFNRYNKKNSELHKQENM